MPLAPGSKAPAFSLEAAVSGRPVSREALKGHRVVLVFHGPRTQDTPKEVGKAVRAVHPDAEDVVVANVVNLASMNGIWKKVADAQIKATYERMAGKLTGVDPADYIILCPDWDNKVAPSFGFKDSNQAAGVAVLDKDGRILGIGEGDRLGDQAVGYLGI